MNSDAEITTQIRELLDWDIRVNSALVEVRTNEQVVHLSGTVGTATEEEHIIAMAHQTGATRVDARDLFVAYWALNSALRREKFAPRADEAISNAVRVAASNASNCPCSSRSYIATLTSWECRLRVEYNMRKRPRNTGGLAT